MPDNPPTLISLKSVNVALLYSWLQLNSFLSHLILFYLIGRTLKTYLEYNK